MLLRDHKLDCLITKVGDNRDRTDAKQETESRSVSLECGTPGAKDSRSASKEDAPMKEDEETLEETTQAMISSYKECMIKQRIFLDELEPWQSTIEPRQLEIPVKFLDDLYILCEEQGEKR
ncbi:expressed unknown protein [Seminavis robusta]|uniref:Uncharacterized protein n=1 Tax=Seminavis robusta TaxID=568900 RepID=A0A9N8DYH4_9STRA|nr:expressed unknown protein [Seminavis robusta]|eukprot:Sro369_g128150.1 n/a (121) ;mRNA; f:23893-24337